MQLKQSVNHLMMEEYDRAAEKFGPRNHSPHESYAIILEEVQEAQDEMVCVRETLADFWEYVKQNDAKAGMSLEVLETAALCGAAELIQVAAMAYKARR